LDSETEPVRELRQSYHDSIAVLREQSLGVLGAAITAAETATRVLVGDSHSGAADLKEKAAEMTRLVAEIDSEVVTLLALEAPVARDLRVILASRDVSQISLLCVGLSATLGTRSTCAGTIAENDLTGKVKTVAAATLDLLRRAEAVWMTLDADGARSVLEELDTDRYARRAFFAAVLMLKDVPIEAALDLGLAARVFDRLMDHAAEIAGRVIFAVTGQTTSVPAGEL
jgi:phosphate transport system protein